MPPGGKIATESSRRMSMTRSSIGLSRQQAAVISAVLFFFGWLAILYAGADHPPPPGFLIVVLIDLVAALVVYRRVPVYAAWARARRPRRWLRALLEGVVAGLIAAGLAWVVPIGGEPSIQRTAPAALIWFVVLAVVGAVNAVLIYGLSAVTTGNRKGGRS